MVINQNPPISEEEASNVIPFERPRLAIAGKGPTFNNWLKGLEAGTHFLSRDKQIPTIDMSEYTLIRKEEFPDKDAFLLLIHMGGKEIPIWVDPARFSNKHELVCILQ